ncbi:MAG TPA: DNA polymerase I, partial [Myxococcota bacterium]|nr:DNA polymerase I [Myxococcota bacterium]
LALAGDSSDNVPGVLGIGKKTAADLINEFGPLEQIIRLAPLIKQKSRREKIMAGQNLAILSKQLVTIDTKAPIDCTMADLRYFGIDQEKTRQLFLELDFNRLLHDTALFSKTSAATHTDNAAVGQHDVHVDRKAYRPITHPRAFAEILDQLRRARKVAIDTETDGLDSTTANLVGLALAWGKNHACYIPLAHSHHAAEEQLDLATVRKGLKEILSGSDKVIVAQNAKFDHKVLVRHGFVDFAIGGDPMLASYLLHQDQERHNLDDLSVKYLGHQPITFEEVCGPKKSRISFADVSLAVATEYAAEDADIALRLEELLLNGLEQQALDKLYFTLELPLEGVLSRMELTGVKVDAQVLQAVGRELKTRLLELESSAHNLAGIGFNLASPKQTAEILFDKLGLPVAKKTKTGYSTDSSVLERLAPFHPIARVLLEHRMCAKLINTYIETLPMLINTATGRLHTNYNQFVTATGRLSSSDPNLQNIPARTREGRRIRQAFIARPGHKLISLDYSQVELRLLAFVTQDPVLLDSFAKDEDVHQRTAQEIFEIDSAQVTKEQRDAAKTINFGLLYGMGAQRLSQTLGLPRKSAQDYLDKYFAKYAGILRWKNEALADARRKGEVRTLFGRKRSLPELSSRNAMEQARAERMAINTPIQGTAADIIKMAMIETDTYLRTLSQEAHLIMQVHDELIIEAPMELANELAISIAKIMSQGHGLDLNLKVDYGIADNWADAH